MFDLIHEIIQTMRTNRLRTFLTGFAVTWGIFMLIILLGMSRGVTNTFEKNMSGDRSNSLNLFNGYTSKPFKGYKEGRYIQLDASDIEMLENEHPELIKNISTGKSTSSTTISTGTGSDYISKRLRGTRPSEATYNKLQMKEGRFINESDLNFLRKVIVLNEADAKTLFGSSEKVVGKRVNAFGLSWLIVGVYKHEYRSDVYIPISTAMNLMSNTKIDNMMVVFDDNISSADAAKSAEAEMVRTMAQAHEFDPTDESALSVWNRLASSMEERNAFGYLNIAVWVIGILTLLSGIVGVSNIMFVSVRERTHEIGIRRAIGAKPRSILIQTVIESISITTIFGYIGVVMGMVVTQTADHFLKQGDYEIFTNPTVSLSIALEVTLVLIIAGALAGLFPAIRATKVKPVEALRDE